MSDLFGAATDHARRDLLARQDEWIQQQADALGWTVEKLAEVFSLEYGPLELDGEPGHTFRVVQEVRLKRRDDGQTSPGYVLSTETVEDLSPEVRKRYGIDT